VGLKTVALESTGIYWISLYEVLEQYGFEIRVVNARHVKHVPGRTKTDVLDCQWIQKLHSFGLLNGSFRPDQQIRKLRTYMRLRDNLGVASTQAVHHMQKALFEMNVQLSNVISDIVGETGLRITEAIIAGQRDPMQLAALCSTRIKASRETMAKSRQLRSFSLQPEVRFGLSVCFGSNDSGTPYLQISFTFAATATPSFLSDSAERCKPSTPSVEIIDPAFRYSAPPILATAS
jgi:hypothetical protein